MLFFIPCVMFFNLYCTLYAAHGMTIRTHSDDGLLALEIWVGDVFQSSFIWCWESPPVRPSPLNPTFYPSLHSLVSAVIYSCPFSNGAVRTSGEAVRRAIAETDFVGVTGTVQVTFQEVGFRSGRELVSCPTVESWRRGCGWGVETLAKFQQPIIRI